MKKLLILLMLPLMLLTSCGNPNSNQTGNSENKSMTSDKQVEEKYTLKDFFPFKENVRLKYNGTGSEFAAKDVYTDFINGDKIQLRTVNSGTTTGEIFQIVDGELRRLYSKHEFYYRDNLTNISSNKYEVLIKEPLAKGTTWTLANGERRYISDTEKEIDTPSGKYKTLEITTERKDSKEYDYYAPNVGLVKSVYKGKGNMEVSSSLEKIYKDVPVIQTVRFYYPDYVHGKTSYKNIKLIFNTNDTLINEFEKYFKTSPAKDYLKLMGAQSKINTIALNTNKPIVDIDFSSDFVKNLNAGSGAEMAILQCIANTLGDYYNIKEVNLTVDKKPFASGHIILNEGETLKVDFKKITELE